MVIVLFEIGHDRLLQDAGAGVASPAQLFPGEDVKSGKVRVSRALTMPKAFPYEDLGFAKIDTHRDLRTGFPEVIFCKGKTIEQLTKIMSRQSFTSQVLMATKAKERIGYAPKV